MNLISKIFIYSLGVYLCIVSPCLSADGAADSGQSGTKVNNFQDVIDKMKQQQAEKQNMKNQNAAPTDTQTPEVDDAKKKEELKKKFEAIIKEGQERKKAKEQQKSE
ncbi:MAG: hypothetical protein HQK64_12210 [Desulfamplus sp.]|nr:hypothetical protein [Desulfamplus sp.]MBF0243224.1 hypothetical protein [Desulfamplus sp.]MBF0389555.1 hypothetical protein [Desulfamplus sp.]